MLPGASPVYLLWEKMMEFHDNIYKYKPWSYTKLSAARRCPSNFTKRYIDKIQVPYVMDEKAIIGKAVHEILEESLKGRSVKDAFVKVCASKDYLTTEQTDLCLSYKPGILHFVHKMKMIENGGIEKPDDSRFTNDELLQQGFKFDSDKDLFLPRERKPTKIRKKFVETKLAINDKFEPSKYWGDDSTIMRGAVDYAYLTDAGHMFVFDHKSGGRPTKKYYYDQMMSYENLCYYGIDEDIRGVQTLIYYVSSFTFLQFPGVSRKDIEDRRKFDFIKFANDSVKDIDTCEALPGKHCDWCGFSCPNRKK